MEVSEASRTLNLLGYVCPVPVSETRRALAQMPAGSILELLSDDPDVRHDIPAMVKRVGCKILSSKEIDGEWHFQILVDGIQIMAKEPSYVNLSEADAVPADARLPMEHGDFRIRIFHEEETGFDHVALTLGDMRGPDPVLVRLHSECLTGDALGSLRCDCGSQLNAALQSISEHGWGCLLYLRQEGRGIGLHAKIQAYNLQDRGADTLEANLLLGLPGDARDYAIAAEMLKAIDISHVCLLTNNINKVEQLKSYGIEVVERMPLVVGINSQNRDYLKVKAGKMGHEIEPESLE